MPTERARGDIYETYLRHEYSLFAYKITRRQLISLSAAEIYYVGETYSIHGVSEK